MIVTRELILDKVSGNLQFLSNTESIEIHSNSFYLSDRQLKITKINLINYSFSHRFKESPIIELFVKFLILMKTYVVYAEEQSEMETQLEVQNMKQLTHL